MIYLVNEAKIIKDNLRKNSWTFNPPLPPASPLFWGRGPALEDRDLGPSSTVTDVTLDDLQN